ncbi:hypothetical protein KAU19_03030 [Candidatus Parcubacteria bacterium]|nr:hypothetical protein [Candidatus Parcubacteria bacterium]
MVHTDHLSGSNVITDSSGAVEQNIYYYPFGDIWVNNKESGFDEQRKFTGHEYDKDTGLSYMVDRYYHGTTARFLS